MNEYIVLIGEKVTDLVSMYSREVDNEVNDRLEGVVLNRSRPTTDHRIFIQTKRDQLISMPLLYNK